MENIKKARKKSNDPIQENLRQHKDNWNHEASLLIAQLIAFKKGLNGRGESRAGLPPGSIKDSIPREISSYLDQMADRYNKLISDAHSIIDEQNNYSENRKKSLKEKSASYNEEILKLSSWWGSRVLTYTKNLLNSDEEMKLKILLLKISVDLIKQLKYIDSFIVSKNINAIPNAIYNFDKFISSFNKLILSNIKKLKELDEIKNNKSDKIESGDKNGTTLSIDESIQNGNNNSKNELSIFPEKQNDKKELQNSSKNLSERENSKISAQEILDDIIVSGKLIQIMNLLSSSSDINLFENGIKQLRKELDNIIIHDKNSLKEANNSYDDLKKLSSFILKINNNSFKNQLIEAEKLLLSKTSEISIELEKIAQKFLNKWINRQKLKILPNSDDRIRLEASKKINYIIDLFDKFQNLLENNEPNINVIIDMINNIKLNIIELANDLYYLGKTHNDEYEQNKLNGKPNIHQIKLDILRKLKEINKYL